VSDGRGWFSNFPENHNTVISFKAIDEKLHVNYEFVFSDGKKSICMFNEEAFFQSFYINDSLYNEIGKELCTAVDVALAMGGCEAVVEGFYSLMKRHKQSGDISNDSLVDRTVIDWCLPIPMNCPQKLQNVQEIYFHGNVKLNLKKHHPAHHVDQRQRGLFREQSKVTNRLANEASKFDFLL